MSADAPATKKGPPVAEVTAVAAVLAGVGGWALFGPWFVFPVLFGVVTAAILGNAGPRRARPFIGAASVLVAHVGWFVAGAVDRGTLMPVPVDVVLMLAGAAWLVLAPGLAPAVAVVAVEIAWLAVNASILAAPVDTGIQKAIALHLALRVLAIAAVALGFRALRRSREGVSRAALARTFE